MHSQSRPYRGPIDVSLMQTCSQIAHELRPVMFRNNTITFRTGWVDREASDRAASFASALDFIHKRLGQKLYRVCESITEDMIDRTAMEFPQCITMLHLICGPNPPITVRDFLFQDRRNWRLPPSTHRKIIQFILSLGKGTKKWWEFWKDDEVLGQKHGDPDIVSLLTRIPDPWIILDEDDIASLREQCQSWNKTIYVPGQDRHPMKRYFSAAALAIQFLGRLDSNVLSAIRHIELDEVHASVAYPECHGLGLVSIMQQYPGISISRRVDTRSNTITGKFNQQYIEDLVDWYLDEQSYDYHGRLRRVHVSQAFMRWFEEAVALSSYMPPDRFSVTFHPKDAESTLAILEQVIEDSIWQSVVEQLATRPSNPLNLMDSCCFFPESFTRGTREIQ